jgi:hypothetical protein
MVRADLRQPGAGLDSREIARERVRAGMAGGGTGGVCRSCARSPNTRSTRSRRTRRGTRRDSSDLPTTSNALRL